jgi:hypothetical protein
MAASSFEAVGSNTRPPVLSASACSSERARSAAGLFGREWPMNATG